MRTKDDNLTTLLSVEIGMVPFVFGPGVAGPKRVASGPGYTEELK